VFFVDDEVDTTQFETVFEILRTNGIDAVGVNDVASIDEILLKERGAIDCVVLDIIMPPGHYGLDETERGRRTGVLVLEAIRRILGSVAVIVVTVTARSDIRKQVRDLGAVRFISVAIHVVRARVGVRSAVTAMEGTYRMGAG
jgi:CheY-like chemotaxis protein